MHVLCDKTMLPSNCIYLKRFLIRFEWKHVSIGIVSNKNEHWRTDKFNGLLEVAFEIGRAVILHWYPLVSDAVLFVVTRKGYGSIQHVGDAQRLQEIQIGSVKLVSNVQMGEDFSGGFVRYGGTLATIGSGGRGEVFVLEGFRSLLLQGAVAKTVVVEFKFFEATWRKERKRKKNINTTYSQGTVWR